jgi:hypothetical protein
MVGLVFLRSNSLSGAWDVANGKEGSYQIRSAKLHQSDAVSVLLFN